MTRSNRPPILSTEELREHFSQYGDIESINVKTDPQTGRSRGFAFIVFSAAEAIEKVTAVSEHIINNKKVDPKKAKARQGKIFVGGLTTDISDDEIKAFFSQFGTVSLLDYIYLDDSLIRIPLLLISSRLPTLRCRTTSRRTSARASASSRSTRSRWSTSC